MSRVEIAEELKTAFTGSPVPRDELVDVAREVRELGPSLHDLPIDLESGARDHRAAGR